MTVASNELSKLISHLEKGNTSPVKKIFLKHGSVSAVELIGAIPEQLRHTALLSLPAEMAADILEKLPDDIAAAAVMNMEPASAAPMVEEMLSDEGVDLLQDVSSKHAEAILAEINPEDASTARALLQYEEDSAGGLMQAELIAIPQGMTAGEVVRQLQAHSKEYSEFPASYIYVVNDEQQLQGVISLRSLLLCKASTPIAEIVSSDIVSVEATVAGTELLKMFRRHQYLAIPVVDKQNRLLGLVTQDDAMRFAEEEADEEMLRFTGIVGGDEFRIMPLRQRSKQRLLWLSINIILNVLAASIIAYYQETLQAVIALAVFLPIISDMSGCSGNQAVAVSIRELSLDRISPRHLLWVLGKELTVGLVNGLVLGSLICFVAWIWQDSAILGLIVGSALWINTIVAVSIGGLVPLILRYFNKDPAIASGPILTTLTDMCGFFLILGIASQFLHLL